MALYSLLTKRKFPTLSLVEEYKFGKARLFQTLRDSRDPLVKNAQPSVKIGRKWKAEIAVADAESALKMKEMIDIEAIGRAGLGFHPQRWWSKESTIKKRKMVLEEIHHLEEARCIATGLGQKQLGTWTKRGCKRQSCLMERPQADGS